MKRILTATAIFAFYAILPAQAQDQSDPNPPATPGAIDKPQERTAGGVTQESTPAPPTSAMEQPGDISGPSTGTHVNPPTVVQKDNVNIPDVTPPGVSGPSGTAAGAPGIEGKRGTQAGKEWTPPAEIRKKPSM